MGITQRITTESICAVRECSPACNCCRSCLNLIARTATEHGVVALDITAESFGTIGCGHTADESSLPCLVTVTCRANEGLTRMFTTLHCIAIGDSGTTGDRRRHGLRKVVHRAGETGIAAKGITAGSIVAVCTDSSANDAVLPSFVDKTARARVDRATNIATRGRITRRSCGTTRNGRRAGLQLVMCRTRVADVVAGYIAARCIRAGTCHCTAHDGRFSW